LLHDTRRAVDPLILRCRRSLRLEGWSSWFETRQRVRAKRGPMINSDALLTIGASKNTCAGLGVKHHP
jgi:hypothetical protein